MSSIVRASSLEVEEREGRRSLKLTGIGPAEVEAFIPVSELSDEKL